MASMFRSDGPGNDGTPVAVAIEKATNAMLLQTDWGTNLEICDMLNTSPDSAIPSAVKMLRRQLRSDEPQTIKLTLELIDACLKNCAFAVHKTFSSKPLMGEVIALTEGKKGWEAKEQALKLIQQWSTEFSRQRDELPGFHEAYASLRTRGVQFPELETSAPVFTPPSHIPPEAPAPQAAAAPSSSSPTNEGAFEKLKADMNVVSEKVKLCGEMLAESPGIEQDEALSEVVGFLEACQPRLQELIEAGVTGQLSEELISRAFQVNDEVTQVLDAERNGIPYQPKPSPFVASPPPTVGPEVSVELVQGSAFADDDDDDDDIIVTSRRTKPGPTPATIPPPSTTTTAPSITPSNENDLLDFASQPPPYVPPPAPSTSQVQSADPFSTFDAVLVPNSGSGGQTQPQTSPSAFMAPGATYAQSSQSPPVSNVQVTRTTVSIEPEFDPAPSQSTFVVEPEFAPVPPSTQQPPILSVGATTVPQQPTAVSPPPFDETVTLPEQPISALPPPPAYSAPQQTGAATNPFDPTPKPAAVITTSGPTEDSSSPFDDMYQAPSAQTVLLDDTPTPRSPDENQGFLG